MKIRWIFLFLIALSFISVTASSTHSNGKGLSSEFSAYEGKLFTEVKDPEFINYDLALRNCLVKKINKQFGLALDPKTYSGFDLLEIEALLKCKKSSEPFDIFLKMFPKSSL